MTGAVVVTVMHRRVSVLQRKWSDNSGNVARHR